MGHQFQGFEPPGMPGHLCVMEQGNNAVTEIRIWGYIDATMEIQESISVRPFSRMQGTSRGFLELHCSFGDWLFHWVFDALADIKEDV
jgi:hypothetical protein